MFFATDELILFSPFKHSLCIGQVVKLPCLFLTLKTVTILDYWPSEVSSKAGLHLSGVHCLFFSYQQHTNNWWFFHSFLKYFTIQKVHTITVQSLWIWSHWTLPSSLYSLLQILWSQMDPLMADCRGSPFVFYWWLIIRFAQFMSKGIIFLNGNSAWALQVKLCSLLLLTLLPPIKNLQAGA